jgi:Xaa-Pro dipeptidase
MGALINRPRAERVMDELGLDGLLGASFENVYYLSGFWSENFFVLPRQTQVYALAARNRLEQPHLVCGLNDAAGVFEDAPDARVNFYGRIFRFVSDNPLTEIEQFVKRQVLESEPFGNIIDATVAAFEEAGLTRGTIAYDDRAIFPHNLAELQQRLSNVKWVPGWEIFRRIRAVKTDEEIRRLKAALALNEKAVQAAMSVAKVGITEQEMIEEFERTVVSAGGKPTFTQLVFGRRGGHGNVMKRDAKLAPGDIIRFDVGTMVEGYNSDIARNFTLEEPPARTRELYNAVLRGEEVAAAAMKPGVTAAEVFDTTVKAIREAGIPDYQRHHVGHGIGLEVYDLPTLMPTDHTPLEANMVFEVETPYYVLGFGGLQPEDTVIVTENGGQFLNSISRQLEVWK